jgi:hypothetical protein
MDDGIDSLMIEDRLLVMVVDITGDGECTWYGHVDSWDPSSS